MLVLLRLVLRLQKRSHQPLKDLVRLLKKLKNTSTESFQMKKSLKVLGGMMLKDLTLLQKSETSNLVVLATHLLQFQ
jgi:hypothetical protein